MSRMIFTACALFLASGCCNPNTPNRISLVLARLETLGPNLCRNQCCDCVPHRPWCDDYRDAWDYHITEHTAQKCAFRDYGQYRKQSGCRQSHHFKMGFIAAYEDLALNRRPIPPILPPPKYWNAYYRSCAGQGCIEDWFAGYDAGLEMGLNSSVSRFHEIFMRRGGCNSFNNMNVGGPAVPLDDAELPMDQSLQQFQPPSAPTQMSMPGPASTQGTIPLRVLNAYPQ